MRWTCGALLSLMLAAPASLHAAGEGAWHHKSLLGARINREGLSWFADTGYRVPLSSSKSLLLKGTHLEAGATWQLSPASFHPGVYVQLVPVTPLVLRASIQQLRYFGTFTAVHEFEGGDPDWSDEALDQVQEDGDVRHETGLLAQGRATLRLKFGKVLALFENRLGYVRMRGVAEGNTWYETTHDVVVEPEDGIHTMYGTLGFLLWGKTTRDMLLLALRYQRDATFETEVRRQTLSGAIIWRPSRSSWFWGAKPTFGLMGGGYLQDANREGEPIFQFFVSLEWDALGG